MILLHTYFNVSIEVKVKHIVIVYILFSFTILDITALPGDNPCRFSSILSPIFSATFVKTSILGHARSGHQVRSSDTTTQKIEIVSQLQYLRESYETFGIVILLS